MPEMHVMIILFTVALLSASVIPAQGELVFFALLATAHYDPWLLMAAAGAGTVIGTGINWFLGRYLKRFEKERWFPVKKKYLLSAEKLYRRHGISSLLLAGVPLIGDPITLVAGLLKVNFWVFLGLAATAKCVRYGVAWGIYAGLF